VHFDPELQESSNQAVEATLGGPIVRDRLWFFAAYYQGESKDTPEGSPTTWTGKVTSPKAKLTWQISPAWRGTATYLGNTPTFENFNASRGTMPEAAGFAENPEHYFSLGIDAMLSDAVMWNLRTGYNRGTYDGRPMSGDLETIAHYNVVTEILSANFPNQKHDREERLQAATDLTWFLSGGSGSHELKGGIEVSDLSTTVSLCSTGTAGGVRCNADVNGYVFYDVHFMGQDLPFRMIEDSNPGPLDTGGLLWTGYVQDAWRPIPNLTVKAGLRYDSIGYDMDRTNASVTLDRWQPRLGLAWDITGDAKNVLRASAGRYMDPATMNLPYYGVQKFTRSHWGSCSLLATGQFPNYPHRTVRSEPLCQPRRRVADGPRGMGSLWLVLHERHRRG
jgi:outer membrane receptor protein involved in Fe transport